MSIKKTKEWFEAAVPVPTEQQFSIQVGVHAEEFVEMLESLLVLDEYSSYAIADAIEAVKGLSEGLKLGGYHVHPKDEVELLDALADQIVTAVGCAHMAGMDIVGALDEVNRSNFSKFEDGKPVFNDHGKIKKGRDYKAPELAGFVGA